MKKTLALMLTVFMLLTLFSACSGNTEPSPSASPAVAEPTGSSSEAPIEAPVAGEFTLPIMAELTTFQIWSPSGLIGNVGMSDFNESRGYQEVEKKTNMHIEWQLAASGSETEQFSLMIASQSYPDAILGRETYYIGGVSSYIDDGVIIDLKDAIAKYAPNYQVVRTSDDTVRRMTMTDEGALPAFYTIKRTLQPSWLGGVLRDDWIQELGLEMPKTYDDYYSILKAFKDKYSCEIPLSIVADGLDPAFLAGYGLTGSGLQGSKFIADNGVVKYSITEDAFLDYLTMMNKWFSEDLIDKDFYTRQGVIGMDYSLVSTGKVGVFDTAYTWINMAVINSDTEGYSLSAAEPPVRNVGDQRNVLISSPSHRFEGNMATITTACEDVEAMTKWFDYFYTEEGARFANWGVEGESYTMTDDQPVFTDTILKDPDGMPKSLAWIRYTCAGITYDYDWTRELSSTMTEAEMAAGGIWDANWNDTKSMPNVSLTSDESNAYSTIITDVETYVKEMVVKFIIGSEPLSNFDSFRQKLIDLGIEDATAIYQAAYDRYMSR